MADVVFTQPERRSLLLPAILSLTLLAAGLSTLFFVTPHRIADLTVTHVAILPTHTVMKSDSIVVGAETAEDDLYVLVTVRLVDQLKLPLFLKDITGSVTVPDDTVETVSAVEKDDLPGLYASFPKMVPLTSTPLLRETTIDPHQTAEGMVILHFNRTLAQWKARKSASVTLDFYHQGPITAILPRP